MIFTEHSHQFSEHFVNSVLIIGLNRTGMAPSVIIEPIKVNEAANEPVKSDKIPPMTGPIRLEMAWNRRINPYEDPMRSTPIIYEL